MQPLVLAPKEVAQDNSPLVVGNPIALCLNYMDTPVPSGDYAPTTGFCLDEYSRKLIEDAKWLAGMEARQRKFEGDDATVEKKLVDLDRAEKQINTREWNRGDPSRRSERKVVWENERQLRYRVQEGGGGRRRTRRLSRSDF